MTGPHVHLVEDPPDDAVEFPAINLPELVKMRMDDLLGLPVEPPRIMAFPGDTIIVDDPFRQLSLFGGAS